MRLEAPPASPRPVPRLEDPPSSTAGLLPFSLLATAVLLLLPGLTVALGSSVSGAKLQGPAGWGVTVLVSLAYMYAGARLWARHPRSKTLSWGELVLWSWARRRRAEGTLARGAEMLEDEARQLLDPDSKRAQVKVLRELNAALEVRDPYTRGHARRVERHAHRIALALRCSDDDIFDIRLAASLHDVGKIQVPDRILRKEASLDESEWAIMKRHSEVGAELVHRLGNPAVVAAVRWHHERWDGRGYPDGISGEQIPLGARIIAVADTFDAITSCRPYRDRADRADAVSVLKAESGKQFDPAVVSAFLSTTPHQAAAFAGIATLVLPLVRRAASQWGVVVNKAGAVTLAGTMTASAFTGVAAVERPLAKRLQDEKEKPAAAAPAEAPSTETEAATKVEGAPSPRGKALGHDKKAHEGGNGKSHAGGKRKSHGGDDETAPGDKGKALGHDKKAHEGGNGKSHAGGNGKSQSDKVKSKPEKAAGPVDAPGKTKDEAMPAPEAGAPAPAPAPEKPKPAKPAKPEPQEEAPPEEPVAPAPEPEAPPATDPAEGKGKGKTK